MKWEDYSRKFEEKCLLEKKSKEFITEKLDYAKSLFDKGLPIIFDDLHLSYLTGYHLDYIYKVSNSPKKFYRNFKIVKKNGKERLISEPLPNLKDIQRWILDNILMKCSINSYIKSYIPNKSIKDNARFHRKQEVVLNLDIKDYFPSIKSEKVYKYFKSLGYSVFVSTFLTKICTLNNSLPQGSPTSPMLSNLITNNIDIQLSKFCVKNKIRYTRYADDLTFSGNFNEGFVIKIAEKILMLNGFLLNKEKIRARRKHQRQEVTGIVVNKKMQVSKEKRKKLRQEMYYINKFGLNDHLEKIKVESDYYLDRLLGICNFILFINSKDEEVKGYKEKLWKLKNLNNNL